MPVAIRSRLVTTRHPPSSICSMHFPVSSTERESSRAAFLGMELNTDLVISWQWTLLALELCHVTGSPAAGPQAVHPGKSSLTQDTSTQRHPVTGHPVTEPQITGLQCHQASIQNLLSGHSHGAPPSCQETVDAAGPLPPPDAGPIGPIIRIFTQHNRKPPWMR